MSLDNLKNAMPEYAKDIKLNLSSLANEEVLSEAQKWGTFLASALATENPPVINALNEEAKAHLSEEELNAAKAAAAIMAMNNIYYRFAHIAGNKDYGKMPAKLRMNVIANPGADKASFELWSFAVSVINGCGMCIDAHEAALRKEGITTEQIQASARIASVVHAAAAVVSGEQALEGKIQTLAA